MVRRKASFEDVDCDIAAFLQVLPLLLDVVAIK